MNRSTPDPHALAEHLDRVAALLHNTGPHAVAQAAILAARGWPASTTGSSARSSDTTSSTERAAGLTGDDGPLTPPAFAGLDERLAGELSALWAAGIKLQTTVAEILSHADDDDPVPAGTGHCARCNRFCRPDHKRPHNRIKAGFCPSCYTAWLRAGRPERSGFVRDYDARQGPAPLVAALASVPQH